MKHPRRAGTDKRKQIAVVIVVILVLAGVFSLLEMVKRGGELETKVPEATVQTHKMPRKESTDYSMGAYTSVPPQPPAAPTAAKPPKPTISRSVRHGSIAIIIDDMGASPKDAERLLAIDLPVTFSIIPGLSHSKRVAEIAHAKGRGVMVHMPMEPQGYPQQRLEKNGLLLSQSDEEIAGKVASYLQEIPYAIGANNHMGSGFTEHEDKMIPVLDVLKQRNMFFIDSRTSSRSVGYALAKRMGIPAGTRNIFLDNDQSVEKVKAQLNEAASMAEKRGSVIAICHPHPGTIQALQEMMPELHRRGISFISAAQIVR